MRIKTIFWLWLPLAISFELMMLEGPAIQGAIGRLADTQLNLAAWGLTMQLSLIIESPVIMLLATAIALVKDADTYRALKNFMISLIIGCTLLTLLIAFTPLFDLIAGQWMKQPRDIVIAARPAMQIMLLWTAAIGWRRFYQGVLVRFGQTRLVSWGTFIRLVTVVIIAVLLARAGHISGVQVGAWAIMAAVIIEALATSLFAMSMVRNEVKTLINSSETKLTQFAIWKFHLPLAVTTLLTLLAMPITSAALARLPFPKDTLAAWPVTFMVLLVMRGWGLAVQEITVAYAGTSDARPTLRRFAMLVGIVTSLATLLLVATPLLRLYMTFVLHLPPRLFDYVQLGVAVGVLSPFITSLGSWTRGLLVARGDTSVVYQAMGINLGLNSVMLIFGVLLHLPGIPLAAVSFSAAAFAEFAYLAVRAAKIPIRNLEPATSNS